MLNSRLLAIALVLSLAPAARAAKTSSVTKVLIENGPAVELSGASTSFALFDTEGEVWGKSTWTVIAVTPTEAGFDAEVQLQITHGSATLMTATTLHATLTDVAPREPGGAVYTVVVDGATVSATGSLARFDGATLYYRSEAEAVDGHFVHCNVCPIVLVR